MKDDKRLFFSGNPYQYTRAIRFRAIPEKKSGCFESKVPKGEDLDESLLVKDLTEVYDNLCSNLYNLFYIYDQKGTKRDNKKISINKSWLKRWHKYSFHLSIKKNSNNKDGKYKIIDPQVTLCLKNWLEEWKNYTRTLDKYLELPKESQVRRSEIANVIAGLSGQRMLPYIKDFLHELNSNCPHASSNIKDFKTFIQSIEEKFLRAKYKYLPDQSNGIEIARVSLNYYTVNKKPKEYYDDVLAKTKNEIYNDPVSSIKDNKLKESEWEFINISKARYPQKGRNCRSTIFTFKTDQEKTWLKKWFEKHSEVIKGDLQSGIELSLDQTYEAMKAFKAEQKSIFYEVIAHIANKVSGIYRVENKKHLLMNFEVSPKEFNLEGINKIFSLFTFVDRSNRKYIREKGEQYHKFKGLTKNIQEKGNSKKRGEFLFGTSCYFTEYGKFCELYKCIAQNRGRCIAQIKGLQKEQREALQTQYWGLIYCSKGTKQLWLIPREKMQAARNTLYESKRERENSKTESVEYLCSFESLTMRALNKLCFSEESTFIKDMPQGKLKVLYKQAKEYKTDGNEERLKQKDEKKLKFFKKLLISKYAQEQLHISNFDLKAVQGSNNLEIFEKNLETACYYVKEIPFNTKEMNTDDLVNSYDVTVLDITSYDLEGRNKAQNPVSENRLHTDIWQVLWNNLDDSKQNMEKIRGFKVGEVRLNPEVKIRYRKADENLKKYLETKKFDTMSPKFKHRKLKEQFTVGLTIALNAGKKYADLAFRKPEDLLEKINDFNKKLNEQMKFETTWKYGIDRGNTELATLCLVKFDPKDTYKKNEREILKPRLPDSTENIKCYTLKNYKYSETYCTQNGEYKKRLAIKNPSYFIDNKSLFDKKTIATLDLTTAKVIKGNIITNGDVMTYLKLKKAVAKRRLYELHYKNTIKARTLIERSKWKGGKDKEQHPHGVLNIKLDENKNGSEPNSKETIYMYDKKYEDVLSKENIQNSLNSYLNQLRSENDCHTPTILQINHLKNALIANMVGVICHLQKEYPGFIILEDLNKEQIQHHLSGSELHISRGLETALYNKFQALGLVPPHVKDIIQLRENLFKKEDKQKLSQIGCIVFVSEKNTSKDCPYCEKSIEKENEQSNKEKYVQQRFLCGDTNPCGFDTYKFKPEKERVENYDPLIDETRNPEHLQLFKDIDGPDKVAAYNVAKKVTKSKEIQTLKLNKSKQKKENTQNNNPRKPCNKKIHKNNMGQKIKNGNTRPTLQTAKDILKIGN